MAVSEDLDGTGAVAIVGARGFVGRALADQALARGAKIIRISRGERSVAGSDRFTPDLAGEPDLVELLQGADVCVNLAARVHIVKPASPAEEHAAHQRMNVEFPVRLALAAKAVGVRRFVQLSSVAAIGSSSPPGIALDDDSSPAPATPYGMAKLQADTALRELDQAGFSTVSLRPPAIYGPGAAAHFAQLISAARRGIPLPIGGVHNARSFAFVGNIADAILTAAGRPVSGAYIVTDSRPLSTAELYRRLMRHCGRRPSTPAIPAVLIRPVARLLLGGRAASLIGDAAFDGSRFADCFDWTPPFDLDTALRATIAAERAPESHSLAANS